jgi:hypothetical protein
LRGGAFNNNTRNVRCAYRNRNNPNNDNRNNGFRVVVPTFFVGQAPVRNVMRVRAVRVACLTETRKMAEPVLGRACGDSLRRPGI